MATIGDEPAPARAFVAETTGRHDRYPLETLLSSSAVPVVVTDGGGRCIDATPSFLDLAGYEREDLASGTVHWRGLGLPAERSLDDAAEVEAYAQGAAPPYPRTLVVKDGQPVPVLISTLVIAPGDRRLLRFVIDLSAARKLEGEREASEALLRIAERARAEAESASRAKDEFLAVVSHELRAPLQSTLGWVSLLREGRLDAAQQQRALHAIERGTRKQTQRINDLLDVARLISGRLRLDAHPFELAAVIREPVEGFRQAAESHRVRLEASLPDCGVLVGDPARIRQVVANLLSNAIKFTPAGGTVMVECERTGEYVVLRVRDTGEGISSEFLPHVFARFRQADPSSVRRHGGMGLGLTIASRIVALHGGRIAAHSAGPGRGATFEVRLPARDTDFALASARLLS